MGSVLDAWCTQNTLKGIDFTKLSNALEQARLSYHAQAIRAMNGDTGKYVCLSSCLSLCLSLYLLRVRIFKKTWNNSFKLANSK